jgi:hypothetical protein
VPSSLSGSGLARALACPAAYALPEASEGSSDATRGTAVHRFLELVSRGEPTSEHLGALPDCPELVAELTEPTYTFKGDRLILEPKDDVKDRIGRSPDIADALALTFAAPIAMPQSELGLLPNRRGGRRPGDYDPLEAL